MNIGIIGLGVVGSAVKYGLSKLGHNIKVHDLTLETSINDVLDTRMVFICVPTPSKPNGACDTSIVEEVVRNLCKLDYKGYICIKSTVIPGTTRRLIEETGNTKIKFIPEFLRERCATTDFTENHQVLIVGTDDDDYQDIIKAHGRYPAAVEIMSTTEAECCKYFLNTYNATLVTFANSMCSFVEAKGGDYATVRNAMTHVEHVSKYYLDSNKSFKRYSGNCLPGFYEIEIEQDNKKTKINLENLYNKFDNTLCYTQSTDYKLKENNTKRISNITCREINEELICIETNNGILKCTKDHLLPVSREGKIELIQACELLETDMVFIENVVDEESS